MRNRADERPPILKERCSWERDYIGGVPVDFASMSCVLASFRRWIERGERTTVACADPYGVVLSRNDRAYFDAMTNATLVVPDGVGVSLAAWLLGYGSVERVSGPTLLIEAIRYGEPLGWRHYFFGGAEGVVQRLVTSLCARHPRLAVAGLHTPPFRREPARECDDLLAEIDGSAADVLWVGLGAPKQEKWAALNRPLLRVPIIIGVGAAFDFHAGTVRWAPATVRRVGLEWLWRLMHEPRRLWKRNAATLAFLAIVGGQWLRGVRKRR